MLAAHDLARLPAAGGIGIANQRCGECHGLTLQRQGEAPVVRGCFVRLPEEGDVQQVARMQRRVRCVAEVSLVVIVAQQRDGAEIVGAASTHGKDGCRRRHSRSLDGDRADRQVIATVG